MERRKALSGRDLKFKDGNMAVSLNPYKDEWFHIGRKKSVVFQ